MMKPIELVKLLVPYGETIESTHFQPVADPSIHFYVQMSDANPPQMIVARRFERHHIIAHIFDQ